MVFMFFITFLHNSYNFQYLILGWSTLVLSPSLIYYYKHSHIPVCFFTLWQPNPVTKEEWSTITNGDGTLIVRPWEEGTLCILSGCYESRDKGYPLYVIPNTTCTGHTCERFMKLLCSWSSFSLVTFSIGMQVGGHYSLFTPSLTTWFSCQLMNAIHMSIERENFAPAGNTYKILNDLAFSLVLAKIRNSPKKFDIVH